MQALQTWMSQIPTPAGSVALFPYNLEIKSDGLLTPGLLSAGDGPRMLAGLASLASAKAATSTSTSGQRVVWLCRGLVFF